ncbi:hypothetical protein [Legionella maioricensis]|uniref:Uncharacterized protein n=1 Tax=Legionella maioricensis TaxID=2896528 RepID=A0A9X2IC33_9GAMM|nr:hypothetical protein [Legionella maioricensis]MCL9684831.1 hypothetical protein [Legionella maioricensis]MCL9688511.1 hypothetical protein [Legionella maioricensis]
MGGSKEILKNAQGFDKDKWPNFASPDFTGTINKYYQPPHKTTSNTHLTTEIFNDKASAESAYDLAIINIEINHEENIFSLNR